MSNEKKIVWLSKGLPKTLTHKGKEYRSGIAKDQTEQLNITFEKIVDDDVENHEYHGGKDRVICVYPYEHYHFWESTYGKSLQKAAFGENLTTVGMKESDVCVGDVYQIGDAIVQVSQGRFPCATINKHTHIHTLLNKMIELGYTGYFFRVLEEGTINTQSKIKQLIQHPMQLSVATIHETFFHTKELSKIETILSVAELSNEWKVRFEKLYQQEKQKQLG
ncbi:MOSC domain-containing protein [Metabacillus niabensis]|uniref:MOSC domain-containing protein YiiM n=1 Tax=Metabacillus niabensis TaxID=324854 RepID=A0ABT9YWM0_9BACI|nr:MOSC domain-containing protein [Metabacillus niabensis]MDQ0223713.1 MOSC domain-containing protein YiiM [Metabacillus niabensis]PAD67890.1 MOSC domain-containing protein [Bacillus sp. 7586-K]